MTGVNAEQWFQRRPFCRARWQTVAEGDPDPGQLGFPGNVAVLQEVWGSRRAPSFWPEGFLDPHLAVHRPRNGPTHEGILQSNMSSSDINLFDTCLSSCTPPQPRVPGWPRRRSVAQSSVGCCIIVVSVDSAIKTEIQSVDVHWYSMQCPELLMYISDDELMLTGSLLPGAGAMDQREAS